VVELYFAGVATEVAFCLLPVSAWSQVVNRPGAAVNGKRPDSGFVCGNFVQAITFFAVRTQKQGMLRQVKALTERAIERF
jgi:hypothetical protein